MWTLKKDIAEGWLRWYLTSGFLGLQQWACNSGLAIVGLQISSKLVLLNSIQNLSPTWYWRLIPRIVLLEPKNTCAIASSDSRLLDVVLWVGEVCPRWPDQIYWQRDVLIWGIRRWNRWKTRRSETRRNCCAGEPRLLQGIEVYLLGQHSTVDRDLLAKIVKKEVEDALWGALTCFNLATPSSW